MSDLQSETFPALLYLQQKCILIKSFKFKKLDDFFVKIIKVAEGQGFEPSEVLSSPVLKTVTIQ